MGTHSFHSSCSNGKSTRPDCRLQDYYRRPPARQQWWQESAGSLAFEPGLDSRGARIIEHVAVQEPRRSSARRALVLLDRVFRFDPDHAHVGDASTTSRLRGVAVRICCSGEHKGTGMVFVGPERAALMRLGNQNEAPGRCTQRRAFRPCLAGEWSRCRRGNMAVWCRL